MAGSHRLVEQANLHARAAVLSAQLADEMRNEPDLSQIYLEYDYIDNDRASLAWTGSTLHDATTAIAFCQQADKVLTIGIELRPAHTLTHRQTCLRLLRHFASHRRDTYVYRSIRCVESLSR